MTTADNVWADLFRGAASLGAVVKSLALLLNVMPHFGSVMPEPKG
jgi:hypothetical protein